MHKEVVQQLSKALSTYPERLLQLLQKLRTDVGEISTRKFTSQSYTVQPHLSRAQQKVNMRSSSVCVQNVPHPIHCVFIFPITEEINIRSGVDYLKITEDVSERTSDFEAQHN